jgi:hypothetical protein
MEQNRIFVDMALKAWNIQLSRVTKFFDALDDAALEKEIAPGKNRVIYLLGHLIAANDSMLQLVGNEPRLYAHLDEAFLQNPDKTGRPMPEAAVLRADWQRSNEALAACFARLSPEEWMGKHSAMTEEEWINEPGRNRLSVLINRTNHMAYHLGQLVLLPK